jgi:hypothetical protein
MPLLLATFRSTFAEFASVPDATVNTFIDLINCCYELTDVTDSCQLNKYYWLLAHFVAVSSNPQTGGASGPSGSFMPISSSAGLVSLSFQQLPIYTGDMAFMLSTRYGQVYYEFARCNYIKSFYL